MSNQKLKGTLYDDHETVKRFRDFENRYYQEVIKGLIIILTSCGIFCGFMINI